MIFDDIEEGRANVTYWYRLNDEIPLETVPYRVEIKQPQGYQFINTHSIPVSLVFHCNINV